MVFKIAYFLFPALLLAIFTEPSAAQGGLPHDFLERAQQQFSQNQYDSASYYAKLALKSAVTSTDQAEAYYELGRAQRRLDFYADAQASLANAIRLTQDSNLTAQAHYELGKSYSDIVRPEVAIYHFQRAMLFNPDTLDLVRINEGIADEYNYYYFDYTEAEKYYEKALAYLQSLPNTHEAVLLRLLYNLATTHHRREDYFTALDYAQRATRLAQETQSINLGVCYSLLGMIYHQQREYDLGIVAYKNAVAQATSNGNDDNPDLGKLYNNLGLLYAEIEQHQTAITYYRKAQAIAMSDHYPRAQADLADSYQYLGNAYTKLHTFTTAQNFLNQALYLKRDFYGDQHPEVATALEAFARYYEEQNQLDSALIFQQQALVATIPSFSQLLIDKNPSWSQLQDYSDSYQILNTKARLLHHRYLLSGTTDDLTLAISTFLLADSLMHLHRVSYENENSQLLLLEDQKLMYEIAIESCYLKYQNTPEEQYLRYALYFIERSKAAILWDVLRDVSTKSNLGVSDSLQQAERSLRTQLARVVNDITELERQVVSDSSALPALQQKRFQILRRQRDLQAQLQDAYPNYVQLKYASPSLPWEQLQKRIADGTQHILEFFWGESYVYSMRLSRGNIRFHRIAVADSLTAPIAAMQLLLQRGPSPDHYQEETAQYINSAFTVYQQFIAPVLPLDSLSVPFLTIIPDGPLAYLPFEALLTQQVTIIEEPDYRKLPYLLAQSAIQYAPSLQVLLNTDESSRGGNAHLRLLAFGFTDRRTRAIDKTQNHLEELPGTYKEVSAIGKLTSARLFSGPEASETRFKHDAESYQIIHLALHGKADTINPSNNVLFFPATPDSSNDGQLHSFELYDLQLKNTKLAVLSACETGTGSWKAGEGVYSMGRGFAYAGCPSIIMSLWKVNDVFTAQIMPTLYRLLYKGARVDKALQKAKLRYIKQANKYEAHPSFWAAFVLQGEASPVVRYQHTYWVAIVILLISLGYFGSGVLRKKKAGAMHPATL
uniref:CHAT domain-containing protein n=1 Tax=Roseihalotalea indica TaxID=2867963 RepID=A0AA49Q0G6_9BACT|nr:CHAT domain-containing protein [Tunicatimonas sp. TK19036]